MRRENQWLPVSLFATGRVQCEDCGAPLRIESGAAVMECRYCGGKGIVERRLRSVEAVVEGGVETMIGPEGAKWTPWHAIDGVEEEGAQCPVCGSEVREGEGPAQGVYRCGHCGTSSKLERRLRRNKQVTVDGEESEAT